MTRTFNHRSWLTKFNKSLKTNYSASKSLRAEIFRETVNIANERNYKVGETYFYDSVSKITESAKYDTKISVMHADCLEVARLLVNAGHKPTVLNMANSRIPGGSTIDGAGAQEENLFRRSNLFQSLYKYFDWGMYYSVLRDFSHNYPIHPTTGAIYSSSITVFRASEGGGYALLEQPFKIDIISNAAIYQPETENVKEELRLTPESITVTKDKIRSIFRVCYAQGAICLVLSAFGCGAFRNPPRHMAQLFKEVLAEEEFKNVFDTIVFAIIDDHNAHRSHNLRGNYLPFLEVFEMGI